MALTDKEDEVRLPHFFCILGVFCGVCGGLFCTFWLLRTHLRCTLCTSSSWTSLQAARPRNVLWWWWCCWPSLTRKTT